MSNMAKRGKKPINYSMITIFITFYGNDFVKHKILIFDINISTIIYSWLKVYLLFYSNN